MTFALLAAVVLLALGTVAGLLLLLHHVLAGARQERAAMFEHLRRAEHETRTERERLTRAAVAKNTAEFQALTKVIEGDQSQRDRYDLQHAGGIPTPDEPWPEGVPRNPEGL